MGILKGFPNEKVVLLEKSFENLKGNFMAKYSYEELRSAATGGRRIGGWQEFNVYSCSKYDYDATKSNFYVLYDDGNKLVRKGQVYGSIDASGVITECPKYWYNTPMRKNDKVTRTVPASGYSAEVIADDFFRKLDQDINALLAGVDSMTFDVGDINV